MKTARYVLLAVLGCAACGQDTATPSDTRPQPPGGLASEAAPAPTGNATFSDAEGQPWTVWNAKATTIQSADGSATFSLTATWSKVRDDGRSMDLDFVGVDPSLFTAASLPHTWVISSNAGTPNHVQLRRQDGSAAGVSLNAGQVTVSAAEGGGLRFTIDAEAPFNGVSFSSSINIGCAAPGASGQAKGPGAPSIDPELATAYCKQFSYFRPAQQ